MTAEPVADPISTQPYRSTARKNRIIRELALASHNGDTHRDIARRNGVTKNYVSELSMQNREEIVELQAMAEDKLRELWIMDPYNRALERMTDIEEINEEIVLLKAEAAEFAKKMGKLGAAVGDMYYKALAEKHRILKQLEESSGQLPTRTAAQPDHGRVTYEIEGVDLNAVGKEWEQAGT